MRKQEIAELLRREAKAILRMVPWLVAALLVTAVMWRTDLAAIAGVYQSPSGVFQSPPEGTEPPTDAPTVEPTVPRITATPTTEIAATPTTEPTTAPSATVPVVTEEPTLAPTPSASLIPTLTATPSATASPTPTATPSSTQSVDQGEPTPEDPRYSEGDSGLRFDFGMLFDSVALGLTYMWLCCGVLVLFGIPVIFIILWVASKRQRETQEADAAPVGEPQPDGETGPAQPPGNQEQLDGDS